MPDLEEIPTGAAGQAKPSSIDQATWDQLATIEEMKTAVRTNIDPPVDREFDWNENVTLAEAVSPVDGGNGFWREIAIRFTAYGVGQPQPPWDDRDDPLWLLLGTWNDVFQARWLPEDGSGDAVSTGQRIRALLREPVAMSMRLSGKSRHDIVAEASAFEDDPWMDLIDDFIDGIRKDVTEFVSPALLGGITAARFKSLDAAKDALDALQSDLLDSHDAVGGDESILFTTEYHWWRAKTFAADRWTARKWQLHTSKSVRDKAIEPISEDRNSAWYLGEWIIELSTEPDLVETALHIEDDLGVDNALA